MKKFFKLFFGFFVLLGSPALFVSDIDAETFIAMILITTATSAVLAMSATFLKQKRRY